MVVMSKLLSRNGVAYDLENTPYVYKMQYGDNVFDFKFSSKLYMDKFMCKSFDNRKQINESLTKRFGFAIENNLLADIKLYASIEKRGFLIANQDRRFHCLNNIVLDGQNQTIKNLQE
jgi:hypothetical protein